MHSSFATWEIENFQVAQFAGVRVAEVEEWTNAEFYDYHEFMLVQNEVDRRAVNSGD